MWILWTATWCIYSHGHARTSQDPFQTSWIKDSKSFLWTATQTYDLCSLNVTLYLSISSTQTRLSNQIWRSGYNMLLIATITADMHGCCSCFVDSASTELLLSCFGSLYDFGWFASWCLCSFNNILSIGKTVLIAGFQALIWILEAFLNCGHKQDCNRHQSDLAVEVRAACRPADAAVLQCCLWQMTKAEQIICVLLYQLKLAWKEFSNPQRPVLHLFLT